MPMSSRSKVLLIALACVSCAGPEDADLGASEQAISAGDLVLYARNATTVVGNWSVVADTTAAGGGAMYNPDAGAAKIAAPLATPASYFELSFPANAGTGYHLWLRLRAQGNSYSNDSVYVQFSDSVDAAGAAANRIGTTSGLAVVLENCSGAGVHGWGWNDDVWCGVSSADVRFAASGSHRLRVQQREDGVYIDQIVLSPDTYATASPGALQDDATTLPSTAPTVTGVTPASGPDTGGTAVTLTGTRFAAGAQVRFGGTAATVTALSATSLTATAPAHAAGAVDVTVTNPNGESTVARGAYTYTTSSGGTAVTLRMLTWNVQHGEGTCCTSDGSFTQPDGTPYHVLQARWIADLGADVVCTNETNNGLTTSLPADLEARTGRTWYHTNDTRSPPNMIASRWPIVATRTLRYASHVCVDAGAVEATLDVAGHTVNVICTHLDVAWGTCGSSHTAAELQNSRIAEVDELKSWASSSAMPRLIAGDMNSQYDTTEMQRFVSSTDGAYFNGWVTAYRAGTATSYADNPPSLTTRTRRSGIDHIFVSAGDPSVTLLGAAIPDLRDRTIPATETLGTSDDLGARPSDHNLEYIALRLQ